MRRGSLLLALAVLPLAGLTLGNPAKAADFYAGKQMRIIVGSATGGIYDIYGRLMAAHMQRHIPGNPAIIVQNMPGASSIKAANYVANIAPKDGTVICSPLSSVPASPLLNPKAVRYDANALTWIGSITSEPFVGYVWHTAKVKTFDDAKKFSVTMGGNAVGAAGVDMAIISNQWFGTKFKIITGYRGSATTKLAIEKQEVDGTFANSWSDLKAQKMHWLTEKKVNVIVQHGFEPHPDLKDVPLFPAQAKTKEQRQAMVLMLARQEFSKPYFGPPGMPADRLQILRDAFEATVRDPKFLAAAKKANLDVHKPMSGEDLAAKVKEVAATPDSVVKSVQKLFNDFNAGKR